MFFFAVSGLYTFLLPTVCLRFAYAVAVSAYAGLLYLDLPTRAYAYHVFFDFAYAACVWCFFGVFVCLVFSCFAYADLGRDCQLVIYPIRNQGFEIPYKKLQKPFGAPTDNPDLLQISFSPTFLHLQVHRTSFRNWILRMTNWRSRTQGLEL